VACNLISGIIYIEMKTFSHSCIKCAKQYSDSDEDAYYCEECNVVRKEIAKKIDAQRVHQDTEQVGGFKAFEALAEAKGGRRGNGLFVNARDMGIF